MIHIIIGTKAQLIKMAPIMKTLADRGIAYRYISTGQHRETMDDILANFGLPGPDLRLYEGKDITSIPAMASWAVRILWRTLRKKREIFDGDTKGIVLVHGDTFSTLLGALMGRLVGLKVGHVESGLRSFNLFHPFPEEITRLLTFRLSQYMFCPGPWATANLRAISGEKIDTGGNTLSDALKLALQASERVNVDIPNQSFAIVTLHRFENLYCRAALERVVSLVEHIARHKKLIFILHKPTEKKLREFGLFERLAALTDLELRQRYDYFRFLKLIMSADFIVSDGGSNQEECYYLGKPILLLRKATERQEGVDQNCVLSAYDVKIIDRFLADWQNHRRPPHHPTQSPSATIANRCIELGL